MKKRLRKKLHIGEFQELGFSLSFQFKDGMAPEQQEAFIKSFLIEGIEDRGLCFIGSGNQTEWDGLVMQNPQGTVSEEQRQNVIDWLTRSDDLQSYEASELLDIWYE
jgi:uncharacterized protein YggL (DUF469 family)